MGLGRGANARHEYGLQLQRVTGQTACAYCGVSLVDDYYHWLLLQVDHVVPVAEALCLGVPRHYFQDLCNLVLACGGCNGFDNRHVSDRVPQPTWSLDEFLALRDAMFAARYRRIAECRKREMSFFERRPWEAG